MSKNFELLQQIGNEEELFQAACQAAKVISGRNGDVTPKLNNEARERILQSASLPDVLTTGGGTSSPTLAERCEPSTDLAEQGRPAGFPRCASAEEFRNSRNSSSPISEPGEPAKNRVTQSDTKSSSLRRAAGVDWKSKISSTVRSRGSSPKVEKETLHKSFQQPSLTSEWFNGMKRAVGRWGWKLHARDQHSGVDVNALTHEEEIKLVERVFPIAEENSPRLALFAGLGSETGCASICARAGEILAARAEGPVCVVDANFRSPSLHKYFGVGNDIGLVEATLESGPIQNFVLQIPVPDLWLMPSGKAAAQLGFPAMADGLRVRMAELRATFKYVVIHSGPFRLDTSAMLLSRWTDGVVLVLEANSTRRDTARRAKESLAAAGVSVLGFVLNNRTFPIPDAIYRRL